MIKAVIFDMDGLLIDSEPLWQEAEVKVFGAVGVDLTPAMMLQTMGLRVDEVVEYWFRRQPWQEISKEKVAADVVEEVIRLVGEKGVARPGVTHAIELFERKGLPMAIASSSAGSIIDAVVERLGIRAKIQFTYSAEHEPYGKPHPGVYITTSQKLGVSREECLALEDSPNGVLAAKAARMYCFAVPDPNFKDDRKIAIADLTFQSLEDIREEHLATLL